MYYYENTVIPLNDKVSCLILGFSRHVNRMGHLRRNHSFKDRPYQWRTEVFKPQVKSRLIGLDTTQSKVKKKKLTKRSQIIRRAQYLHLTYLSWLNLKKKFFYTSSLHRLPVSKKSWSNRCYICDSLLYCTRTHVWKTVYIPRAFHAGTFINRFKQGARWLFSFQSASHTETCISHR